MGKGDKKSKRGKITMGSYGVSRPRRKAASAVVTATEVKPAKVKKVEAATEEKPKKKTTKKKEGE